MKKLLTESQAVYRLLDAGLNMVESCVDLHDDSCNEAIALIRNRLIEIENDCTLQTDNSTLKPQIKQLLNAMNDANEQHGDFYNYSIMNLLEVALHSFEPVDRIASMIEILNLITYDDSIQHSLAYVDYAKAVASIIYSGLEHFALDTQNNGKSFLSLLQFAIYTAESEQLHNDAIDLLQTVHDTIETDFETLQADHKRNSWLDDEIDQIRKAIHKTQSVDLANHCKGTNRGSVSQFAINQRVNASIALLNLAGSAGNLNLIAAVQKTESLLQFIDNKKYDSQLDYLIKTFMR